MTARLQIESHVSARLDEVQMLTLKAIATQFSDVAVLRVGERVDILEDVIRDLFPISLSISVILPISGVALKDQGVAPFVAGRIWRSLHETVDELRVNRELL